MVAEADQLPLVVLGHEHGHDELLGPHVDLTGAGAVHEIVDPLGAVRAGVGVPDVAEGGEPGVKARVGVAVGQRVGQEARQDGVGLAGARERKGVDVAAKDLNVGVRRTDVPEKKRRARKGENKNVIEVSLLFFGIICQRPNLLIDQGIAAGAFNEEKTWHGVYRKYKIY